MARGRRSHTNHHTLGRRGHRAVGWESSGDISASVGWQSYKLWCMGASGWCAGRVAYERDGELVGEHHLQGESAVYGRESLVGEWSDKLLPCI